MEKTKKTVLAVGAHPDDIEFMMSGTFMLLGEAGCTLHYMNVANGSNGTSQYSHDEIVRIRREEGIHAAQYAGAIFHESLVDDLEVYYEPKTLKRLSAVVREIAPDIILTHGPMEYMEDHSNTCRLVVTAAFSRGMMNFPVDPPTPVIEKDLCIYHAMPYGLTDGLRRPFIPEMFVDVESVMERKASMLAMHRSQKEWLDVSQGQDSYIHTMEDISRQMGGMSGLFEYAEGWIRHAHMGFCGPEDDPVLDILGEERVIRNPSAQD